MTTVSEIDMKTLGIDKITIPPETIDDMVSNAVPIWDMLGITEEEYIKQYHKNIHCDLSNNEMSG